MKMHSKTARLALAGLALSSLVAGAAQAAPGTPGMPGREAMMAHGPMGHGGPGGGLFGGMMSRLLDRVNATPEQRAQIQQIVQANAAELRTQHEAGRALREQAMALFAQPNVDAAALEALRLKQTAMHETASKRMSAALIDISRVLTPEQRKQMADYMTQRREMMQRHQRERQNLDPAKG